MIFYRIDSCLCNDIGSAESACMCFKHAHQPIYHAGCMVIRFCGEKRNVGHAYQGGHQRMNTTLCKLQQTAKITGLVKCHGPQLCGCIQVHPCF